MREVPIRLLWRRQAQFAGCLLAERLGLGAPSGLRLVCEEVDFARQHVEAVLAGDAPFAVASPAHILESRAPDRLVLLLAIQQRSPLVYVARKGRLAGGLASLRGARIAVWPGREDLELRWMLRRAGLGQSDVTRIETPETLAALIAGEADLAQTTCYHELHEAERLLGPDGFDVITAEPMGLGLIKDGLVAECALVEREPALVQAVVEANLEGWTRAFDDPEAAVAACLAVRPEIPAASHRRQLDDIRALALAGATRVRGLGYPDPDHARRAAQALAEVEGHAPDPLPETLVDTHFWACAPERLRRRDWPT
jgi:NitT/TauT family transport system substrate-binding protein